MGGKISLEPKRKEKRRTKNHSIKKSGIEKTKRKEKSYGSGERSETGD